VVIIQIFRFYYSYFFCLYLSIETAVNSICLGTYSSFISESYTAVRSSNFRFLFVSQSGCKSSNFFLTGKNFLKFFWKNLFSFSSLFLISFSRNVAYLAGCKSNICFWISQAFFNLFLKINFQLDLINLSVFLRTYAVVAGAKVPRLFV
jgi:hypothetical protein